MLLDAGFEDHQAEFRRQALEFRSGTRPDEAANLSVQAEHLELLLVGKEVEDGPSLPAHRVRHDAKP